MARKDRGHRETKRPKKDKAKKGLDKPAVRAPLPTTEVRVRTKAAPAESDS